MRYASFFYKILLLSLSVLFFLNLIEFNWWWLGSFSEFKMWYKNLGSLIWVLKIVVLFAWIFFTIKLIVNDYLKYPIFFTYVFFALVLKNQHPFSNLAVYDTFPKQSFLFFIEDENGSVYNHGIEYRSADLVDIFDTYLLKSKNTLDESQLKMIGKKIIDITKKKNNFKGIKCYKLIRVTNYIEDRKFKSTKQVLYNECD